MSQRDRQEDTDITTKLNRALPIPHDRRFSQLLAVLDPRFFEPVHGGGASPESLADSTPRRVLPLAVIAVLLVVLFALAAAAITWQISGERYVDEVVAERY